MIYYTARKDVKKMAEPKKKPTPAELSKIRSQASRKRKSYKGGRPKGSFTKGTKVSEDPLTSISIRTSDKRILDRYAYIKDIARVEAFHLLMAQIEPQLQTLQQ